MTDWADYYRKAWAKRTEIFAELMLEYDGLSRVLGRFDWFERQNQLQMCNRTGEMIYTPRDHRPQPQLNITPFLFDHATGHDLIIEYGCGYGKRLLELSLAGCDIPMLGLDLSHGGVSLGKKLANLDDPANVGFRVAGWEHRHRYAEKVLVFTCYTAMYQDPFPEEWFEQDATIVMIEPEETIQRLRLRERGIPCTSL